MQEGRGKGRGEIGKGKGERGNGEKGKGKGKMKEHEGGRRITNSVFLSAGRVVRQQVVVFTACVTVLIEIFCARNLCVWRVLSAWMAENMLGSGFCFCFSRWLRLP